MEWSRTAPWRNRRAVEADTRDGAEDSVMQDVAAEPSTPFEQTEDSGHLALDEQPDEEDEEDPDVEEEETSRCRMRSRRALLG